MRLFLAYSHTRHLTRTSRVADEEKLQPSLTRFFRRLSPSTPIQRNNWFIHVLPPTPAPSSSPTPSQLEELDWSEATLGPEDMLGSGPRPEPPKPLPERMRLRVERQTLRRLPRTGAIVFTIRVYMTPFAELGPGEAGRLAAAIRGVKEQEVVYRCVWAFLSSSLFGVSSQELSLTNFLCARVCACAPVIEGSQILKMLRLSGWMHSIGMRCSEG